MFVIYCSVCEKETGLAVKNPEILKEMNYSCCQGIQPAHQAIIKEIREEDW